MSQYEYNQLVEELRNIREIQSQYLQPLHDQLVELQKQTQDAYTKYSDKKMDWQNMHNCKEQLSKLIKKLR